MTKHSTRTANRGFAGLVLSILFIAGPGGASVADLAPGADKLPSSPAAGLVHTVVVRLDGAGWSLAIDPKNEGRERQWHEAPPAEFCPTRVPGVMQDHFPDYHGVAWYWRTFTAPVNPHSGGRYLLRFRAVDYLAEVWVNGIRIGLHEGVAEPFEFDATQAVKPGAGNFLAVRVLNPTEEAIDGADVGSGGGPPSKPHAPR